MKHGWEYKKLGEVSEIVGGSTPKTNIPSYWDGEYSWITPAELNGSKYIGSTERHITNEALAHTNLQLLPVGTVLLTSRAPIGKVAITKIPMYCNQGFKNIVPGDSLFNEFAYWYLTYKKDYIISLGRGATFKEISKSITEQIPIPVPPFEEQKAICSLLDKMNRVIEAKKEQLKELDNLAQAIFYDMFGDPVTNEKGWDIKPFNTVCTNMTKGPFGSDIKKELFVPQSSDTYKVYIQVNAIQKNESLGDYYISKDYFDKKMSRFEVKPMDYIFTCDGTLGKFIRLSKSMERGIISSSLLKITLNNSISYKYFESLWDNYILYKLKSQARNAALIHLPSAKKIGEELIPIPPLPLQQAFAEKVEAIERQKELINQSLREVQTLFDSRMDYWFSEEDDDFGQLDKLD